MQYRQEIDGLRAIAVLPVIMFHAGITAFRGGYVGVDVFFVISGYLITGIILEDLQQGKFSIQRFYERRARRILPALFLIVLACIPFAWMWMPPQHYMDFSQSVVAVSVFSSNILFYREGGYFDLAANEKPLLHTWSLAVEEQYYLIFPILLFILWRYGRNRAFFGITVIALLSLALSEWGWRTHPAANFYLAPTRAWEFLAGSIVAFLHVNKPQQSGNFAALLGFILILFSVFFFDENTPFPSFYAMAPVGGTVLILLYATKGTWVAQLLSLRAFTAIGLISYSAYLWHQPLFAFARIHNLHQPTQWEMLFLAGLSLPLAYLSWRFVEQPFRKGNFARSLSQGAVFMLAATTGSALIAFGIYGHLNNGVPQRLNDTARYYANFSQSRNPYDTCLLKIGDDYSTQPKTGCQEFTTGDKIDVMFIGDSHSHAISYQAQLALQKKNISSYSVAYAGCIGLEGYFRANTPDSFQCSKYNEHMLEYARKAGVKTLVITSRFTLYWNGARFDNLEGGVESGKDAYIDLLEYRDENAGPLDQNRRNRVLQSYTENILKLAREFNVVLLYPIPEAGWNVPELAVKRILVGHEQNVDNISTSYQVFTQRNGPVIAAFDTIDSPNLFRVKPHELLCNTFIKQRCINLIDGISYYFDDDHLSHAGARLLAPYILEQVQRARANGTVTSTQ